MQHLKKGWCSRYRDVAAPDDISQIPPLLWSQFYHTLLPFLELRMGVEQTLVFRWSCRSLVDVVTQNYLSAGDSTTKIFSHLADYFKSSFMKIDGTDSKGGMYSSKVI